MVDYYPFIARAVASLPSGHEYERRAVYERARKIVIDQLRKNDPKGKSPQTMQERIARESAIRKVEVEAARRSHSSASFLSKTGEGEIPIRGPHDRLATAIALTPTFEGFDKTSELRRMPQFLAAMLLGLRPT